MGVCAGAVVGVIVVAVFVAVGSFVAVAFSVGVGVPAVDVGVGVSVGVDVGIDVQLQGAGTEFVSCPFTYPVKVNVALAGQVTFFMLIVTGFDLLGDSEPDDGEKVMLPSPLAEAVQLNLFPLG